MRAKLHRLALLRSIVVAMQAAAIYAAYAILEIRVPLAPLIGALVFLALLAAATVVRVRQAWPVGEVEVFGQLLLDVGQLTWMLYFTGGAINPLAACYLLLVLYATLALQPLLVWTLAVVCMLSYAGLHFSYVPLPLPDVLAADRVLNYFAHFVMYFSLAALVAGFGSWLKEIRRLQLARIQADEERDARERYLLGLATLSAGTAHEISTPLSTMSVVVGELRGSAEPPPDWKEDIDMLWGQIQICKRSLEAMARAANVERLGKIESVCAAQFVLEVGERFRASRPQVPLKLLCVRLDEALILRSDHTLRQGLLNFLGNAADASPHSVEMRVGLKEQSRLSIQVLDRGPGIPPPLRERIGRGLITTKEPGRGSGAGLLIACAAVERFGGTVHIADRHSGGTRVEIELPLFRARRETDDEYGELRIA